MISLLVLAIITYLAGACLQLYSLYYLAYFFLGVHILLRLYQRSVLNNLSISHQLEDDHVFLNEQVKFRIEAANYGRLPVLYLKLSEGLPRSLIPEEEKKLIHLAPGEVKSWNFNFKARRRGLYQLGPLEWETGDVMGYQVSRGSLDKKSFFIFPRILELEELGLPSRLPYGDIKWSQPIYQDPYHLVGVREYQPADSLRRIHWKASARTGQLQVKENQSTVTLETALILNLSQPDYSFWRLDSRVELAITAAASIASYLTRIGQPFSLKTNGINSFANSSGINSSGINSNGINSNGKSIGENSINHPVGRGELHLQKVLETLACLELTTEEGFLDLLSAQLNISWGGTVIVFTEKDTAELIQVCHNLIRRGYYLKLILLGERVLHPQYLNRPFTAPLSIYQLRREEDINGFCF